MHGTIQLLVFEEPNIKIYRCVKGDIDRCKAVNITFHTPINLDIGLFKHQFFVFCVKFLVDIVKMPCPQ